MTDDCKRKGTTTLLAAFSVLGETVIGPCMQPHRHLEFIRFLNTVEPQVAVGKLIDVVLDNYATHKRPSLLAWLLAPSALDVPLHPTPASWLNAAENFVSLNDDNTFAPASSGRLPTCSRHQCLSHQAQCQPQTLWLNPNPPTLFWPNSTVSLYHLFDPLP
jgi:hypothetical protein